MSSPLPPPASRGPLAGLLGNALAGYRLAWAHRGRVLPVVLPVLAVALLGGLALDLLLGRDGLAVVDGVPVFPGAGDGALAWARPAPAVAAWLVALPAGALALAGAARGHTVRPGAALAVAARQVPRLAVGLCAAAAAAVAAVWVVGGVAGATGRAGVLLVLGALAAVAVVAARLLPGVLARPLGGSAWGLTKGRVAGTAGALLLGGVVVPLVLVYVRDLARPALDRPVLGGLADAALLTAVVAAQAGILAHTYLLQRDVLRSTGQESADLAAADARLAPLAAAEPRRVWPGVAAICAPVLLTAAVAVLPTGAPSVRSHGDAPIGAVAVAWPAGRHPVIVGTAEVRFCDNDPCDRYVTRHGGPAVMDGRGAVAVGPDGAVVTAVVSGSADGGGPFVHYARCTRDGCREGWLPVRGSAREPFGWPLLAAAAAPDGALWFALAMPSPDGAAGAPTYGVTLVRCADATCAAPRRHRVATLERVPEDGFPDERRARLAVGADGRPVATFHIGQSLQQVTCDPPACTAPRRAAASAGPPDALLLTPERLGGEAVSLKPGRLRLGGGGAVALSNGIAPGSGALAAAGGHTYVTSAVRTTRPGGPHVTVGAAPSFWRQTVWRCTGVRCDRHPLDVFGGPAGPELMAVGPDGRVLVVRPGRVLLATLSGTGQRPGHRPD
ncbi:hypothetical protein [Spirilliplanes yamanashiensis]|uniref:Uncharacterized protein n=1 Tax=Spirilliplanes yamanashiensis TaxID=42233 RepID=A0A8J4DL23_9ACTN|nr:hypothetical protein [Spirilliplanes yamanashiensis]MDP9817825.1 hypothetical protein [Spirilliplanes yamanashiensis]GIJ04635.1 hypothetical protein Sya03_39870 [Spirilliplanes yamanashiensis]